VTQPNALLLAEAHGAVSGMPNLLARLSEADRAQVLAHGRARTLERGETLFRQGDPHTGIFLVESGLIRVFYSAPSGREITLAYWYPGNFVGGPEVFGGGTHVWSGVATRRSSVLALGGTELRHLITRIPELGIGIIEGLVFKGKCYSALAQMLGTRSVTERLSLLLLSLCQLYGIEEADGIFIGAAFTHEDLAHMVGATRQWVTMTLKRFQEQGVLRLGRGQLRILRADLLAQVGRAGGDGA
jgi:CRP/FNR family transcriptional regulator, cyclic AMP receptor protein